MLHELRVENLLLIERAELRLGPGLNVLTGETGAGKTVLAHAIDLLLGGKARPGIVRPGAAEAYVEGVFALPEELRAELGDLLAPDAEEIVLARRVSAEGRTRAYLGGRSATAADLRDAGGALLSFYGQHEHRKLTLASAQLDILDGFCGPEQAERRARARPPTRRSARRAAALEALQARAGARDRELDLLVWELEEIERADPSEAEEADLIAERERLRHLEGLRAAAAGGLAAFEGDVGGGGARLALAAAAARARVHARGVDAALDVLADARRRSRSRPTTSPPSCAATARALTPCPAGSTRSRSAWPSSTGSSASTAARSRRCSSTRASAAAARRARGRRGGARGGARRGWRRPAACSPSAPPRCTTRARPRRRGWPTRCASGWPSSRWRARSFAVGLSPREAPGPTGADEVEFLIAPNPGVPAGPLRETASGGELSRVMLALMSVAAAAGAATLVFDEVDAGIGGQTARAVGEQLRALAEGRQVICITHLPQIASLADRHFTIVKDASGETALTTVTQLDRGAVVGSSSACSAPTRPTSAARRHAKELLRAA